MRNLAHAKPNPTERAVTLRAIVIGVALIFANAYWTVAGLLWAQGAPSTASLFYNVVFSLFALVLLNIALRRLRPKWALSRGELTVIYVMMAIATAVTGHDLMEPLLTTLPHAFYSASPENGWQDLFLSRLPTWLVVSDEKSLRGYYEGDSSIYIAGNFRPWLLPVVCWTAFITTLLFVMLCINALFRRNWVERAKLSFPVVRLPADLCNPQSGVLRSKALWAGFALTAIYDLANGLHVFYPAVPSLGGKLYDLRQHLTARPWNAIGWTPAGVFPFAVALGWLIPLDLCFSCWFFYIFWKAERIAASVTGWAENPDFPYINEQTFGGYVGLALTCAWLWRHDLRRIFARLRDGLDAEDANEPLSYLWAICGIIVGTAACVAFANLMGLSVGLGAAFFAVYWCISTAVARMRAELGTPVHDLHFIGPDEMITRTLGTRRMGSSNLIALTLLWFFNRAYRGHPMPCQVEGMKMADEARVSQRRMTAAMMIGGLAAVLAAFWAFLHQIYHLGGANRAIGYVVGFGREPWSRLQRWMTNPRQPQPASAVAAGVGLVFTFVLMYLRTQYAWWPLHPAGYAVSGSWSMNVFWLSLLVAWLIKTIILRYAGTGAYRTYTPFSYGLILGECVLAAFWNFCGIALGRETHRFLI